MAECLKGVAGIEEIGTVAGQRGTFVTETHLSSQNLGIRFHAIAVVRKFIGMYEIHALIHFLPRSLLPLGSIHSHHQE